MTVTFASQVRALARAVSRGAGWVEISPYPKEPELAIRVYLRGDLRSLRPQQLEAVITRGRDLAAGQVWKGSNLRVRKVAGPLGDYLEVYPGGVVIPPPFRWEVSDALSRAVARHHSREALEVAVQREDPRYLVFLSAQLQVVSHAIKDQIWHLEQFCRVRDEAIAKAEKSQPQQPAVSQRTGKSTAVSSAAAEVERTRGHFLRRERGHTRGILDQIGSSFTLPPDISLAPMQSAEEFKATLGQAEAFYAGLQEEVSRALQKRFLPADQYLDFALFLLRLAVSDENRESDLVPSSSRSNLRLPYRQRVAYWGLGYVGGHASKEQAGLFDLLREVEIWAQGPDENIRGRQTESVKTVFGLLRIQAASVRSALLVKEAAASAA